MAKRLFKTQLKNTIIRLKFSEAFAENQSCKLSYYLRITTKISLKSRISPSFFGRKVYGKFYIFPLISLFMVFFRQYSLFITPNFLRSPEGIRANTGNYWVKKTVAQIRLFPFSTNKVVIHK